MRTLALYWLIGFIYSTIVIKYTRHEDLEVVTPRDLFFTLTLWPMHFLVMLLTANYGLDSIIVAYIKFIKGKK